MDELKYLKEGRPAPVILTTGDGAVGGGITKNG